MLVVPPSDPAIALDVAGSPVAWVTATETSVDAPIDDPYRPDHILLAVITRVTPDVLDNARALLGDLATASKARWGTAQLESTRAALDEEGASAFGLPEPQPAANDGSVPYALAWLNYWSDATCAAVGFPDAARPYDAILKASGRPVGDGWIVALTPEPLDIRRDDHLRALREASERFDEIGGRAGYARHQQKLRVDEPTLYDETVRQLRHLLIARAHLARFEELRAPDIIADGTRETVEEREAAWVDLRPLWDLPHASPTRDRRLRQAAEEARRLALEDGRGQGAETADAVMSETIERLLRAP
jgi:ADP-ribose pyrophosphatase YjhB (NUDIX family)